MLAIALINQLLFPLVKWAGLSIVVMTLIGRSRNCTAATLHLILLVTFFSILLFPFLPLFMPSFSLDILSWRLIEQGVQSVSPTAVNIWILVLAVYGLVTAVLIGKLVSNIFFVSRLSREAETMESSNHIDLFLSVINSFKFRRKVECKFSCKVRGPMTYGVFRPVVIFPNELCSWSDAKIERFLRHELTHVKRLDWFWKISLQLFCSVFWCVPTSWMLAKRIEWFSELACDDAVILSGQSKAEYADDLLDMAVSIIQQPQGAIGLMQVSQHYQRISAVLDSTRVRQYEPIKKTLYGGVLFCVVLILSSMSLGMTQDATARSQRYFPHVMNLTMKLEEPVKAKNLEFKGVDSVEGIESAVMTKVELDDLKSKLTKVIEKNPNH